MNDPVHEIDHAPSHPVDDQPQWATALSVARWIAVGCVAGLATGFGGAILDGWQAWRAAHSVGADMFAGVSAASWNFTTIIPVALGLTAALIVGTPIAVLLVARQSSALRVWATGGTLVTVAAVAMWPLVAAGTSIVSIKTIQWLSGVDDRGRGTIAHYFYQFIAPRNAFWGLVEAIVFALTLFGLHWAIWLGTGANDRRRRALRVLLATIAVTIVFAAAFALIADQTYGEPGIRVVSN